MEPSTAEAQTVALLLAEKYLDAAVKLADGVTDLTALMGCDPGGVTSDTCARDFASRFDRRAYRRPLTSAEGDDLVALFNDGKTNADADRCARDDRLGADVCSHSADFGWAHGVAVGAERCLNASSKVQKRVLREPCWTGT